MLRCLTLNKRYSSLLAPFSFPPKPIVEHSDEENQMCSSDLLSYVRNVWSHWRVLLLTLGNYLRRNHPLAQKIVCLLTWPLESEQVASITLHTGIKSKQTHFWHIAIIINNNECKSINVSLWSVGDFSTRTYTQQWEASHSCNHLHTPTCTRDGHKVTESLQHACNLLH